VLGDGDLLAFPLLLRSSKPVTVVVARTLFRLCHLGFLSLAGVLRVDREDAYQGCVPPEELPSGVRWRNLGIASSTLRSLTTGSSGCALLAAPKAAAVLWRTAVEERTQTALDRDRSVRKASLRTVELIPPGTVFVSLVSNLDQEPIELEQVTPLQVGAWEASGCGFLRLELWQPALLSVKGGGAKRPAAGRWARPDHELMLRAHQEVAALADRPEASIARSALLDFGPRLRIRGLPRTLAFCLAKAAGADRPGRRRLEQQAYRWLLRVLLDLNEGDDTQAIHRRTVAAISGEDPPPAELEATWLWLRRYSEPLLCEESNRA
jgi:hypothetical protein